MPKIFANTVPSENQYIRSHDPLGASGHKSHAFFRVNPAETHGAIMLILRDPLETFVRDAKQRFERFALYPANIRFLSDSPAEHKAVFYYEDIVKDPATMLRALEFLHVETAPDIEKPTVEYMTAEWETAAKGSRAEYDNRQAKAGGSHTKDRPHDFAFHQRELSDWKKRRVWRYLKRKLTADEFRLLDRYDPNPGYFFGLFGRFYRRAGRIEQEAVEASS